MDKDRSSKLKLLLAFAAVYIIWGSTYLGIRYAIETIPPLLMAGTRFLAAGLGLIAWAKWRGAQWPSLAEWRTALILGALLLLIGNGGVTVAEQRVTSGVAALLVTTEPLWLVLLAWTTRGGRAPRLLELAGLATGFAGVALLVAPWSGNTHVDMLGAGLVVAAAFSWAAGSIYSTGAPQARPRTMANGLTMFAGGLLQMTTGLALGEGSQLHWNSVSLTSVAALAYLAVFGSLLAFSAYTYLLTHTTPAKASSYAFVNPVVAVLLGWAVAGEPVGMRSLLAMAAIVGGVLLLALPQKADQVPLPEGSPRERDRSAEATA